jgi:hypothetical protein
MFLIFYLDTANTELKAILIKKNIHMKNKFCLFLTKNKGILIFY